MLTLDRIMQLIMYMCVGPPPLSLSCVHVARGWMSRQLWYWQVTIVHYWTSPQLWFPTNKTLERLNGFSRPRELPVTSSLHSSILTTIIYTWKESWPHNLLHLLFTHMFQHLLVENSTHLLKFKSFYSCLNWKQNIFLSTDSAIKSWVMHRYAHSQAAVWAW